MSKWRLSEFTQVVRDNISGDWLLHNSFMGAVARIPGKKSIYLESSLKAGLEKRRQSPVEEIEEPDADDLLLSELCRGGFFVPSDTDERKLATEIIDKERETGFGLIILPHENCNFRCVYCYESFERGKMAPNIVTGLKIFVDQKAKEVKRISVNWFGGEPLLARDVVYQLSSAFLESCNRYGALYTSSMTTNGYYLTPDRVDMLITSEVRHYQVTLDGPEQAHNATRKLIKGGGTYKRILDNLVAMRNRNDDFKVTIRVNFNDTSVALMDDFLDEIASFIDGDLRFDLDFHAMGRWGGPNDSSLEVCDADSVEAIKIDLIKKSMRRGFSNKSIKEYLNPHGNICYAGKENSIVVGSDGTIYKCTVAFSDPRNQVGKLQEDGSLLIDETRWNLWTKFDDKNISKCKSCSFSPSCQSRSCPLIAIEQKEPPCPMTKAGYESLVKLASISRPL